MAIKIQGTTIINDQTAYIDLNGTTAVKVPVGTLGQRPTGVTGQLRYNSTDDVFEGYNGTAWGTLGRAEVSATAPSSPNEGDLWWDSTSGTLKIYYDDGTSQQWVDASPTISNDFVEKSPAIITTPEGVQLANTAVDVTFTLEASAYESNLGTAHASSDWQVSDDPTFATTEVNVSADTSNLTSYEVTGGISTPDTFYWRVRYRDSEGAVSAFSTPIEFENVIPPPDTLGQSYGGGFYLGTICAASTCYYIIVAPNATGCASCQWKTTRTTTAGTTSLVDGYSNTYGPMDNATHPAGNFTATRTIGGFSDWYMPAKDELNQLYVNKGTAPAGEGFAADLYWSSTEFSAAGACVQGFSLGSQLTNNKTISLRVRAVRREPI